MCNQLKTILHFTATREVPEGIHELSLELSAAGMLTVRERIGAQMYERSSRRLASSEIALLFDRVARAGFWNWPPNNDCGVMSDSSWTLRADYQGKRKNCFGVFGFEPDNWDSLLH